MHSTVLASSVDGRLDESLSLSFVQNVAHNEFGLSPGFVGLVLTNSLPSCTMRSESACAKLDERSWLAARIGHQGLSLLGEDGGGTHDELAITPHQSLNHRQRIHVYSSQSYLVKTLHLWLAPCTAALYTTASSRLVDVFGSVIEVLDHGLASKM